MSKRSTEHIIVEHLQQPYYGCKTTSEKVNVFLDEGWKIKSVTTGPTTEGVIVVFVLTKE